MVALLHIVATASLAGMVLMPAGSYRPLYANANQPRVPVSAFALDRRPVTRGDFLRFVQTRPAWRRSTAPRTLAEDGYLGGWRGDLDAGDRASIAAPITEVSWFAARAYCADLGKRLPTTDEWEYAAAASETRRDATRDPSFIKRLMTVYSTRGADFRNAYGVWGLHGVQREWTLDPNASIAHAVLGHHAGLAHDASCAGAALGATDATNYPAFLRAGSRSGLTQQSTVKNLGFRCAGDVAG